jgi:hypothetical protein
MPDLDAEFEDVLLVSPVKMGAASGVTPNLAAGDAVSTLNPQREREREREKERERGREEERERERER